MLAVNCQQTWEKCLVTDYGIEEEQAKVILSKLPVEIKEDEQMTKLFLAKTGECVLQTAVIFDDSEDAICAAPESHTVLAESPMVRVLEVTVLPGRKERFHTHKWTSIMVVARQSELIYFTIDSSRKSNPPIGVYSLKPEGLHAVENVGQTPFLAIRFEIKKEIKVNK